MKTKGRAMLSNDPRANQADSEPRPDRPEPFYFEDLTPGMKFDFSPIQITPSMRDGHIKQYGEDWPDDVAGGPKEKGLIPGPMLMSILGGQWGKHNMLAIKVLKKIDIKFHAPFHAGDTIVPHTEVVKVEAHKDTSKEYGYAFVRQTLYNQKDILCCTRDITFLVHKKSR